MKLDTSAAPELALLALPQAAVTPATVAWALTPDAVGRTATTPAEDDADAGTRGVTGPARPADSPRPVTVGYLAASLRLLVRDPWRWWDLVRFDPQGPVRIAVTAPAPRCESSLLVLPPGYHGEVAGQVPGVVVSCLLAGAVTEQVSTATGWQDRPLSPGRIRVHGGGGPSRLVNSRTGYAVTLHARPLQERPVRPG